MSCPNPCDGFKNHNLVVIHFSDPGGGFTGISTVVRWCSDCGAVVADTDVDGRTNAGAEMIMGFLKIALNNVEFVNAELYKPQAPNEPDLVIEAPELQYATEGLKITNDTIKGKCLDSITKR
jgi:hypothetical protein